MSTNCVGEHCCNTPDDPGASGIAWVCSECDKAWESFCVADMKNEAILDTLRRSGRDPVTMHGWAA